MNTRTQYRAVGLDTNDDGEPIREEGTLHDEITDTDPLVKHMRHWCRPDTVFQRGVIVERVTTTTKVETVATYPPTPIKEQKQ